MEYRKISNRITINETDIIRMFDKYLKEHQVSDDDITMSNVIDFAEDCVVDSPVVEKLLNIYVMLVAKNYNIKE